jgi:hypothetical protein
MHCTACTIEYHTIEHHTIQHALYTMHYTLYLRQSRSMVSQYGIDGEAYTMHYTLCTIRHALYTMHYTACSIQHALCTMHYTPRTIHHALYTTHYTPRTVQHTNIFGAVSIREGIGGSEKRESMGASRNEVKLDAFFNQHSKAMQVHYSIHYAPCTIHHTPYTIH